MAASENKNFFRRNIWDECPADSTIRPAKKKRTVPKKPSTFKTAMSNMTLSLD